MTIVFTGGGTVGHVSVNLALIPYFKKLGWDIHYIGTQNGLEHEMVKDIQGVKYHIISAGKLRRYFDVKNFSDPFRVVQGVYQANRVLKAINPDIIFSKGGFVSFPVVVAAKHNRIKVILHESDLSLGLANKLSLPFCDVVLSTFKETEKQIPQQKFKYIGAIVRDSIINGNRLEGLKFCNFKEDKPILTIMGGSLGAQSINQAIRANLPKLLKTFNMIHICGKRNISNSVQYVGYKQFEFINEELADVLHASDIIVSRAGSNSIFEFLMLNKPMLLIPLPSTKSRGDQIYNAHSFKNKGYCNVLEDEKLDSSEFYETILNTYFMSNKFIENMVHQNDIGKIEDVVSFILNQANERN